MIEYGISVLNIGRNIAITANIVFIFNTNRNNISSFIVFSIFGKITVQYRVQADIAAAISYAK